MCLPQVAYEKAKCIHTNEIVKMVYSVNTHKKVLAVSTIEQSDS